MRKLSGVIVVVLATALAAPAVASSALQLQEVATGFDRLTQVTAPRSGDPGGTLYVVEQQGQIWKWDGGSRTLFLDIRGSVSTGNEQGLFSIAFDPGYATNHLVYINYTNRAGDTRIVRYRADAAHTHVLTSTRRVLLAIGQPAANHNGGRLAFGPNGRLYTGQGDGGGSCDPGGYAQNLRSRLGKLLSINPRRIGRGWRIDGYGLRNPWAYSFDRANGRLYVGDVGQGMWEEVSTVAARKLGGRPENYLWDVYEGRAPSGCDNGGLKGNGPRVFPISVYSHAEGCSITGGHAYRGSSLPSSVRGWYFFGDYCSGRIWRLLFENGKLKRKRLLVLDTTLRITSFGEGVGGELYLTDRDGTVYRFVD